MKTFNIKALTTRIVRSPIFQGAFLGVIYVAIPRMIQAMANGGLMLALSSAFVLLAPFYAGAVIVLLDAKDQHTTLSRQLTVSAVAMIWFFIAIIALLYQHLEFLFFSFFLLVPAGIIGGVMAGTINNLIKVRWGSHHLEADPSGAEAAQAATSSTAPSRSS